MEATLKLYDREFPVKFVKRLAEAPYGDFHEKTGIRVLQNLDDTTLLRVLWHEAGHAIFEHFGMHEIEGLKDHEEQICLTILESAVLEVLRHNEFMNPGKVHLLREMLQHDEKKTSDTARRPVAKKARPARSEGSNQTEDAQHSEASGDQVPSPQPGRPGDTGT